MLSSTLSLPQLFHLTHLTESLTKIAKINFASCFKYMWLYHIGYLDVYVRAYVHMENITLIFSILAHPGYLYSFVWYKKKILPIKFKIVRTSTDLF